MYDWSELLEFGRQADESKYPAIEVGGYLTLGSGVASFTTWGREENESGRSSTKAGESGQGAGASAATACAAAPAIDGELAAELGLEELLDYHPESRWFSSSSGLMLLEIPVQPFRSLPYRASIVLEIPADRRLYLY